MKEIRRNLPGDHERNAAVETKQIVEVEKVYRELHPEALYQFKVRISGLSR
jgi:hypothetical protein